MKIKFNNGYIVEIDNTDKLSKKELVIRARDAINAIEKYEGYNDASATWINEYLSSIGYQYEEKAPECSVRRGLEPMQSLNDNYRFCVYAENVDTRTYNGRYVEFGVVTYIYIDMPVIGNFFRIPVYGKSNRVFCFGERCSSKMENVNDAS